MKDPWSSIDAVIQEQTTKSGTLLFNDPQLSKGLKEELHFRGFWNSFRKKLYGFQKGFWGFVLGFLLNTVIIWIFFKSAFVDGMFYSIIVIFILSIVVILYRKLAGKYIK